MGDRVSGSSDTSPITGDRGAVVARLRESTLVRQAAGALQGATAAWAVGGAVRDAALGTEPVELDLATDGEAANAARAIAREVGGHPFELSAEHGTWRVVPRTGAGPVDVTGLRGPTIEADLAERDFTIGAIAVGLNDAAIDASGGEELLDPHGGLRDIASGTVRAVSERSFSEDPLRLLRAARFACDLGLEIDGATVELARRSAPLAGEAAGERILEELRLLVGGSDPIGGIGLLDQLEVLAVVLPELTELRGVTQGSNHHLDVYDHTLDVLRQVIEIERAPQEFLTADRLGTGADGVVRGVRELLEMPIAGEMSRAVALRFGALFHDLGKPRTRIERDGHIGFPGHDRVGAEMIGAVGRRLAMGTRLRKYLSGMSLYHLGLGFLAAHGEPDRRAIHGYLRYTGEIAIDVTLLTVADRLAARGAGSLAAQEMIENHLGVAARMVGHALEWRESGPAEPLMRGDEIAAEFDLEPGPGLGDAVAELEAAQYAGEVSDRTEAVDHLRRFLAR